MGSSLTQGSVAETETPWHQQELHQFNKRLRKFNKQSVIKAEVEIARYLTSVQNPRSQCSINQS